MSKKIFKLAFILIISFAFFLRFFKLTNFPPSLYWEEAALGYDAYSISQTLKDHHGNFLPIVSFVSFGDYKPSLYFYAVVPFIKILGLTETAVRLPSVVSGVLIVIGIGMIILTISNSKIKTILGALIASISPWAIIFSRAAWEANLATALIVWGVYFGLTFIKKDNFKFLLISSLLFCLSMYTYHSARIISPVLGISLVLTWLFTKKQKPIGTIKKEVKKLSLILIFSLLLTLPILLSLKSTEVNHRFSETSIFSDLNIIQESNERKAYFNNSFFSRIFYHRYLLFGREILKNYFSHFNLDYLFVSGESNPRHSVSYFGNFYYFEVIFLLLGFCYLFKNWQKKYLIILVWLFISILPAALTNATPHALRTLPSMPAFLIIITFGIFYFVDLIRNSFLKKISIMVIIGCYLFCLLAFWRHYSLVYPVLASKDWQYGYKEMIAQVNKLSSENPSLPIYISRSYGRPAMYYWFFSQTNPSLVQQQDDLVAKDQGEFLEFKNIKFFDQLSELPLEASIIALASDQYLQLLDAKFNLNTQFVSQYQVTDLAGDNVWYILQVSN